MSFLRVAAVILGLGAVPVLFASAETLSSRVRDAERHAAASSATDPLARSRPNDGHRRSAESAAILRDMGDTGVADRSAAPTFGRIVIDPSGASSFEGRSAPEAEVSLTIDARPLGKTRADATGAWRLDVSTPLTAGDHTIASSSKAADRQRELVGQDIRIAIPTAFAAEAVVAYEAPPAPAAAVPPAAALAAPADAARENGSLRSRAEDLAAAASQRFSEVTEAAKEPVNERRIVQAPPPPPSPVRTQPPPSQPAAQPEAPGKSGQERFAAPVYDWLERSAREYQRVVIKGLSEPGASRGGAPVASPAQPASPRARDGSVVGDIVTDTQIALQDWLARANRTYQTEIVRKLEVPAQGAAGAAVRPAQPAAKPDTRTPSPDQGRPAATEDKAAQVAEAAKRAEQARDNSPPKPIEQIVPVAPPPVAPQPAADDEARRKRAVEEAAAKDAETARAKAADEKRQRDEAAKIEADAKRAREAAERSNAERQKAEQQARAAASKREAEAKAAEDARKSAEAAAKRREDEAKRQAEKKAASEAQRAAEQVRIAEKASEKAASEPASKAAELARKALEQARTGPAKRAAEQKLATELNKSQPGAATPGAKPQAGVSSGGASGATSAESSRPAKAAPRKKDDRIAEGSGEKGPVDLPKSPRASGDRPPRVAAADAPEPDSSPSAGRTAAMQSPRGRKCARAGRDISPPGTYVIGSGDTLSEIAERHYGTARRMWRIVKANRRKLRNPDVIRTCQRIWLP